MTLAHPDAASRQGRSPWLFWLPLAVQTALILVLPFQSAYTYFTGTTVVLQTAPVDPYDFLRGYFVILSYDISSRDTLQALPGWETIPEVSSESESERRSLFQTKPQFYLILEAPTESTTPPAPWRPIRVSAEAPRALASNQIALKGRLQGWQAVYDLEKYYIPEDQRQDINAAIAQVQQNSGSQDFVVEVKINPQGQAVPLSLWVADRNYRF